MCNVSGVSLSRAPSPTHFRCPPQITPRRGLNLSNVDGPPWSILFVCKNSALQPYIFSPASSGRPPFVVGAPRSPGGRRALACRGSAVVLPCLAGCLRLPGLGLSQRSPGYVPAATLLRHRVAAGVVRWAAQAVLCAAGLGLPEAVAAVVLAPSGRLRLLCVLLVPRSAWVGAAVLLWLRVEAAAVAMPGGSCLCLLPLLWPVLILGLLLRRALPVWLWEWCQGASPAVPDRLLHCGCWACGGLLSGPLAAGR